MLKKYRSYGLLAAFIALSLVVVAGCSKPPTEEMAKAEKAVEDAKQKEAPVYVPDLFAKADESLKKAKDFVTGKKYKEAKQAATETEGLAQQAAAAIDAAKAKMKTEAEAAIQDIQKSIDELKAAVEGAAKKKPLAQKREEVQAMITKWEADLAAAKEKLQTKVKEAADSLKAIKDDIVAKKDEATAVLTGAPVPPKAAAPAAAPAAPAAAAPKAAAPAAPAAPAPAPKK